jgi:hypothetical protein
MEEQTAVVERQLGAYLAGRGSLADFRCWFVRGALLPAADSADEDFRRLVYATELLLAEFDHGDWTEEELRGQLRGVVRHPVASWRRRPIRPARPHLRRRAHRRRRPQVADDGEVVPEAQAEQEPSFQARCAAPGGPPRRYRRSPTIRRSPGSGRTTPRRPGPRTRPGASRHRNIPSAWSPSRRVGTFRLQHNIAVNARCVSPGAGGPPAPGAFVGE